MKHILDLYERKGLEALNTQFSLFVRARGHGVLPESLLDRAVLVEAFLESFFEVEQSLKDRVQDLSSYHTVYRCKRQFVQRQIKHTWQAKDVSELPPIHEVEERLSKEMGTPFSGDEVQFATHVLRAEPSEAAEHYGAWALFSKAGQERHREGTLFRLPKKIDYDALVALENPRKRTGFNHTDRPLDPQYMVDQAHYCLKCHKQEKDTCRKGMAGQRNPLGNMLEGCPLDQKVSEMMTLFEEGYLIAALAVITLDNPMVAVTGRRICNACSKACIFQKQEAVDIPSVETFILDSVLELPWGFEIYSLLTRWNPLSEQHPIPKEETGRRVLVVGMGPAGFATAHHLLNDGHKVVGIDGLSIKPLKPALKKPIRFMKDHFKDLEERERDGFGGVAEYGITARWNKNYLLLVRMLLERRSSFCLLGNIRFESTLTTEQAFEMGFDHVALCLGAGKPHLPSLKNASAKGVYQAVDFLMSLQLTGSGIPPLESPIAIIGGGLTAVDAATEALASMRQRDEGAQATLYYRRALQASPAYRINHQELTHALEEGVQIVDHKDPEAILTHEGTVCGVRFKDGTEVTARTVLLATGTKPNTVIAEDRPDLYGREGVFLKTLPPHVSVFGDLHPEFTGSVVHALASAKKGAPKITESLKALPPSAPDPHFFERMKEACGAQLVSMDDQGDHTELLIKAPLASKNLKPGQFFRLQVQGLCALPFMGVHAGEDLVRLYIGHGARALSLLERLEVGEPLDLMGPTGAPLPLFSNKRLAVLVPDFMKPVARFLGDYFQKAGCTVFYEKQERLDVAILLGLKASFPESVTVYELLNAPMQCMMKGICARCLTRRVHKGQEKTVFACQNPFFSTRG